MLLQRLAVDEDVVEEDEHTLIEEAAECLVHQVHEGGRRVGQAEWQHQKLVVPVACAEGGLRHILRRDADLMVAGAQIDLREVARTLQPIEQLVDPRQRVAVLDR